MKSPRLSYAIEQFLDAFRLEKGASEKSVAAYASDLLTLSKILKSNPEISSVSAKDLDRYIDSLLDQKLKTTSIARKISALRQFFLFCTLEFELISNPSEGLSSPKLPKRLPKALTEEQIQSLLRTVQTGLPYQQSKSQKRDAHQARDRA